MSVIRKNIAVWQNWHHNRSRESLDALGIEVKKFTLYLEKLYEDNWKYNLTSLYFPVSFITAEVIESNDISQKYRLAVLDIAAAIKVADAGERETLYEKYALVIFDMCAHYEGLYQKMERDRGIVKGELLRDYSAG